MLSLFYYVGKYVWKKYHDFGTEISEDEAVNELNEYIVLQEEQENANISNADDPQSDREGVTSIGKITSLDINCGLIDDNIPFTTENTRSLRLKLNSMVLYFTYKSGVSGELNAKIMCIITPSDSNINFDDIHTNKKFDIIEEFKYVKVIQREGRNVIVNFDDFTFNLNNVNSDFDPIKGDFLKLTVKVAINPDSLVDTKTEILEVLALASSKNGIDDGFITSWDTNNQRGTIDNEIFFSANTCEFTQMAVVGHKVSYIAIESDQGEYAMRAISFTPFTESIEGTNVNDTFGIILSDSFDIKINMQNKKTISVDIKNNSQHPQIFKKLVFISTNSESQLTNKSNDMVDVNILPSEQITLSIEVYAKVYGFSNEKVVFCFDNFKIFRIFKILVSDSRYETSTTTLFPFHKNKLQNLCNLRNRTEVSYIPGVKSLKTPNFIKVRLPVYIIPDDLWDINDDFCRTKLADESIPAVLQQPLNVTNYIDKLHHLLYFEEIETHLRYQQYKMNKTFLIKSGEYLILEIDNITEKKIPLQISDSVMVCNPWDGNSHCFEGNIHKICDKSVYLRFCHTFHEKYRGEGLNIKFYFSRSRFIKCHFAVDLAFSILTPRLLFPTCIIAAEKLQLIIDEEDGIPYVSFKKIVTENNRSVIQWKREKMVWYDSNLNVIQKSAIVNILRGSLRPFPYVIFGPPGTGKTNTMVETVLQIISLVPMARVLIGAPSNSAANLIAQRLIKHGNCNNGCIVRLVANHQIIEEKVPDDLKPYCATLDIAMENTRKSQRYVDDKGTRFCCTKTEIGRHTITIGTCICLASLARIGFPVGHFTHILVDEAGQCTEPEIMAVLSFANKPTSQIILSGDPLQLGPVIINDIGSKFGLNLSYLERLLDFDPYKRDTTDNMAVNNGYDPRLITKLTYNYRSIQKIVNLSSDLFYNGELVSQVDPNSLLIKRYFTAVETIFKLPENPGIVFFGIRGENMRDSDSPSWYNQHEALAISNFMLRLYARGMEADDIGIISPYAKQVKLLRLLISLDGVPVPKIGSVEEFQGQERKVILLSTVRSQMEYLKLDLARNMGFINVPKRVNVAITRAQILLVIFGNPYLLCQDPLWRKIIVRIFKEYYYTGCDYPDLSDDNDN